MKAVILAGGLGTRLSEETEVRPKPMVEIGGMPILWHIMKYYSFFGINDFIICCGYKGYVIKEYFANYSLHMSDVTFDLRDDKVVVHAKRLEPWRVTLVDTGAHTMTGGRLARVARYVDSEDIFCMTYGDGLGDVDIGSLVDFHRANGKLATVTVARPPSRFGAVSSVNNQVVGFEEKGQGGMINAGFFVLSPEVLQFVDGDDVIWERGPLTALANLGQLMAFEHGGFWQPMDTLREKKVLEELWQSGEAPWKVWS